MPQKEVSKVVSLFFSGDGLSGKVIERYPICCSLSGWHRLAIV